MCLQVGRFESERNTQIPDLVIKRKRKRHFVDPCLGFYSLQDRQVSDAPDALRFMKPNGSSSNNALNSITDHSPNTLLSPKYNADNPTTPLSVPGCSIDINPKFNVSPQDSALECDSTVLTVEAFLKRSVERPAKRYGRNKYKTMDLQNSTIAHCQESNEGEADARSPQPNNSRNSGQCSDCCSPLPQRHVCAEENVPRQSCNKKVKGSLADRLVRAAILSHAQPVDSLMHQSNISTRSCQPLRFQSMTLGLPSIKDRTLTLIDPRRIAPFHDQPSSFHNRDNTSRGNPMKNRPFTRWRTVCDDLLPAYNEVDTQAQVQRKLAGCRPLSFIPVHEAEELYARKMTPANRELQPLPASGTSSHPTNVTPRQPSLILSTRMNDRKTDGIPLGSRNQPVQFSCTTMSSPGTHVNQAFETSPSANSRNTMDGDSRLFRVPIAKQGQPILSPSKPPPSDMLAADPSSCSATLSLSPMPRPIVNKPLKPLATFLGDFLQTVRNATQMQESITSRPHKRRKCTVGTSRYDDTMATAITPTLKPINSMKSFIRTSIRNINSSSSSQLRPPIFKITAQHQPSSQAHSERPRGSLSHTVQIGSHRNDDGTASPTTISHFNSRIDALSSPDVVTALQPKPYRVVLSSSPSHSKTRQISCDLPSRDFGFCD